MQALELYDKALKTDPKFLDALANKGSAFYRLGQYENALKWLNEALKIDPALLVSIYYKTRSLEELGESHLAAEYFKNASKIYYQTIIKKP
jgi:tetratricopeptide (TPR) repeat protein